VVNSTVHTLSEHNLPIDLDSKFKVLSTGLNSDSRSTIDSFTILGTGQNGLEDIGIVSVVNDTSTPLSPDIYVQISYASAISAIGDEVLGSWMTVDAHGQNHSH
jgi:hypothetical protein